MAAPFPAEHKDAATVAALRAGDRDVFRALVEKMNPGLTRRLTPG